MKKGVSKGWVLSLILFNFYSDKIVTVALENRQEGIIVNGEIINNLRYADDAMLLATSEGELEILIESVNQKSMDAGFKLNVSKTEVMVFSRNVNLKARLIVNGRQLEQIANFKYLGCSINSRWDNSAES